MAQQLNKSHHCSINIDVTDFYAAWCPRGMPDHEHFVRNTEDVTIQPISLLIDPISQKVTHFSMEAEKNYNKFPNNMFFSRFMLALHKGTHILTYCIYIL